MRSMYWLMMLAPALASAGYEDCGFREERAAGVDAAGVEKVVIRAGAGDMKVIGRTTAVRVEARGVACASKREMLEALQVTVRRDGNVVFVETEMPQDDDSWGRNDHVYIDLGIALPASVPVEATDSSGDAAFEDLHSLEVQDSSGDLDVTRIAGALRLSDSSGDVEIESAGSVRARDSSGDLDMEDIRGDVEVEQDSSGDIEIRRVDGSVMVRQDSSGGIRIEDVRGGVTVESDSSGDIYAARVGGDFTVSEDGSGSIGHESIRGKVSVPAGHDD